MAQTKRKRRTKHRGNAAGIDRGARAHGAQADRRGAEEGRPRDGARERRLDKPPTWKSAATKRRAMAALFVSSQIGLFGGETPISAVAAARSFALVLYTPLATRPTSSSTRARRSAGRAQKGKR